MTVPSTSIGISSIQTEFGGIAPTALSEYYSGGAYVPSSIVGIPVSGQISIGNFAGKSKISYGTLTTSASITEGNSITLTLSGGTSVPNGTYYWSLGDFIGVDANDFTAASGTFTVSNNTGSFTVTANTDTVYEEPGTFTVAVGTTSGFTTPIAKTSGITIYDSGNILSSSLSASTVYRVENLAPALLTITTSGLNNSTTLYLKAVSVTGTLNTADDFGVLGTTVTVNNNTAIFSINPLTKIGAGIAQKTFKVEVYGVQGGTLLHTSSVITIAASPVATFTYASSITEGNSITVNYSLTNVPATGTYYWALGNYTGSADAADFSATSGSFAFANSSGSFNISAIGDSVYEAAGTFTVNIGVSSGVVTPISTSSAISLIDRSTITASSFSSSTLYRVAGMSPVTATITTSNFANNSTLYITLVSVSGILSTTEDFNSLTLTATVSNNQATFTLDPISRIDITTAQKTFKVEVRGASGGTLLHTSSVLTILANPVTSMSYTKASIYEGENNPFQYNITNVPTTFVEPYVVRLAVGGTAGSADIVGYPLTDLRLAASSSSSYTDTIYDALSESTETFSVSMYWAPTTTLRRTASFNLLNSSNYSLTMSKTGGTAAGVAVTITASLSVLTASSSARSVSIYFSVDNVTWNFLSSGTIAANATSWSQQVYSNPNPTAYSSIIYFKSVITNHTDRTSSISAIWT